MDELIEKKVTSEDIECWFDSPPPDNLISRLADFIWEWRFEDLSKLRLAERGFSQEDILKLLETRPLKFDWPVIHHLVGDNRTSTLISLLDQITSPQQLLSLIRLKHWFGLNVLSRAFWWNRLDLSRYLVRRLSEDEQYHLLSERDGYGMTGLHWAAEWNNSVGEVLALLKNQKQIHHLLSIRDDEGLSVLSYSICKGSEESFQSILRFYTDKQENLLELSAIIDNDGNTSFHYAAGQETPKFLINLIKAACSLDTREHLANVLSKRIVSDDKTSLGLIVSECHSDNKMIYNWAFDSLTNNQYLLFGFPSTLIMYSTAGRPGADQEAKSLETCFNQLGIKVKAENLFTKNQLFKSIRDVQRKETSRNGQIVALMSHGTEGCITDSHGTQIPLKEIEQQMCPDSHRDTPKLLILQCCQIPSPTDPSLTSESQSRLYQSHPPYSDGPSAANVQCPPAAYCARYPDFGALMSTGARTTSERNQFICFLAKAIQEAGVHSSVSQVMGWVKRRFPVNYPEQAPGCQDWFKFDFCIKSILPIYLEIARKTKPETMPRKQQVPIPSSSESNRAP